MDRARQGMTTIDTQRASALLFPIAAFLHAGGMANQEALDIFAAALKKVSKTSVGRKMEHIGHQTPYTDIVALWTRNKRFLDRRGSPRPLRIEGRSGFAALVRSVAPEADPAAVWSKGCGMARIPVDRSLVRALGLMSRLRAAARRVFRILPLAWQHRLSSYRG